MNWNRWNRWSRKLHRWGAVVTAIPLLLVIVSGLLLQVKKQVTWVQPPTKKGGGEAAAVTWDQVLEIARQQPEAEIKSWDDVDRLDVRPGKSLIKVQAKNRWELQIDWNSGQLLSSNYRRSDWIESLHDGTFFGDFGKLYVFLPNGIILLGLWFTGAYLWYLPVGVKRNKKKKMARSASKPSID